MPPSTRSATAAAAMPSVCSPPTSAANSASVPAATKSTPGYPCGPQNSDRDLIAPPTSSAIRGASCAPGCPSTTTFLSPTFFRVSITGPNCQGTAIALTSDNRQASLSRRTPMVTGR
ncbi:Uncharacterised protein [Mycobacteroides abscessus subsp. abscessus]|nr:Uncharacterised protein [Mycobacteroides abscessus subsp. abscessus]